MDHFKQSEQTFASLGCEIITIATEYEMRYGDGDDELLNWEILQDKVHLNKADDPMQYPTELEFKREIDFDTNNFATIFFEEFLPSITGHAQLMDEYHSSPDSSYHITVKNEGIVFHDPDADDPDWIVKQCYLLLIAAVTEADVGVENLWKRGRSGGRHNYADFGKYLPKNTFRAFQNASPLMFCDRENWYLDDRDKDWGIFRPCLSSFNDKRKRIFSTVLLMLDESMSGWRPKTCKTGGLPNNTFEPRKPVQLGVQLKNAVECLAGLMAYQDVVGAA